MHTGLRQVELERNPSDRVLTLAHQQYGVPTEYPKQSGPCRQVPLKVFGPTPAQTPIEPWESFGSYPASSSTSQAFSGNTRCWGSMISDSRKLISKNEASSQSTLGMTTPALATESCATVASPTPEAANSSAANGLIDSTPSRRLCRNSRTFLASRKRPAMPTMAMPKRSSSPARSKSLIDMLRTSVSSVLPSPHHRLPSCVRPINAFL
jgi:hypothetical protein